MTVGGGKVGSPASAPVRNFAAGVAARSARRQAGLAAAAAWRARSHPVAAQGPWPFLDHRSVAELAPGGAG
ncbi:MAG: hypothetical protein QOG72_2443 [Sphingomonadales bacterium]|jgi:hypothetical protein|nr:hypothetical protein [Sphingomonadales bacterium]